MLQGDRGWDVPSTAVGSLAISNESSCIWVWEGITVLVPQILVLRESGQGLQGLYINSPTTGVSGVGVPGGRGLWL